MRWMVRASFLALVTVWLGGCAALAPPPEEEGAVVEERPGPAEGAPPEGRPGAETAGVEGPGAFEGHPLDNPEGPLSERLVYFDFDSSAIKPRYNDLLAAHGEYLASHRDQKVILEGHTDERGSREYNLGLGERRAQSVRRVLLFQGASASQIEMVSYGEEKPAASSHDEAAWAKNRRVELAYPGHRL